LKPQSKPEPKPKPNPDPDANVDPDSDFPLDSESELNSEESQLREMRRWARSKLQSAATMTFYYIESCENAIGTQRANGQIYEAYRTLFHLYGFVLAASNRAKFLGLFRALGEDYIYPTDEKHTRFGKWVDILWRMKEIAEAWEKGKISSALLRVQRWLIMETAKKCERELFKLWHENPPSWLDDELYRELKSELYGENDQLEKDCAKLVYRIIALAKRVLDLMEPDLVDDIINFKTLISGETVTPDQLNAYRQMQIDFTKAIFPEKGEEEE
jgi:hypothetical protein